VHFGRLDAFWQARRLVELLQAYLERLPPCCM
jgi:hypothetical protein